MTLDIALVLALLAAALVLFITEWLRMDLVALLGWRHDLVAVGALLACVVARLVSPGEASGKRITQTFDSFHSTTLEPAPSSA